MAKVEGTATTDASGGCLGSCVAHPLPCAKTGSVSRERGGRQGFLSRFEPGNRQEWREHLDPNGVWDASASQLPAAGVYHGHEGIVAQGARACPNQSKVGEGVVEGTEGTEVGSPT